MSMVPLRHHCSTCGGYTCVPASSQLSSRCKCPAELPQPLPIHERALELFGESLEAQAARRQRFSQRGYC